MAAKDTIGTDEAAFERQAVTVLSQLRAALAALIGAIPGAAGINKAADLQRALGIRSTLAWQVYKLAHAADPLTEGCNVPGSAAMRRFFEAARRRGVPARLVKEGSTALSEFDALVKIHAGDRNAFDSMISRLTAEGSDQVDLQQRRAAFRANSHIWGVQAKTRLCCYVYHPAAADPDRLDIVSIRGVIGLRRLRRNAPWVIARSRATDDDGVAREQSVFKPLDPAEDTPHGVGLLREFCSQPLPQLRKVPASLGMTNVEIEGDSVGNMSAATCLLGDAAQGAFARYSDEHNRHQNSQALIRTPCEVLIHDVLVREGTCGAISPEAFVYGDLRSGDAVPEGREGDLLPLRESVAYLGRGPSVLHTPDVPRYSEMAQYAFDRVGWDGQSFDVYRCRVEYPVVPSSMVVRFDLPPRPDCDGATS